MWFIIQLGLYSAVATTSAALQVYSNTLSANPILNMCPAAFTCLQGFRLSFYNWVVKKQVVASLILKDDSIIAEHLLKVPYWLCSCWWNPQISSPRNRREQREFQSQGNGKLLPCCCHWLLCCQENRAINVSLDVVLSSSRCSQRVSHPAVNGMFGTGATLG